MSKIKHSASLSSYTMHDYTGAVQGITLTDDWRKIEFVDANGNNIDVDHLYIDRISGDFLVKLNEEETIHLGDSYNNGIGIEGLEISHIYLKSAKAEETAVIRWQALY